MKRVVQKSWGAELVEGGIRFRLWAPTQQRLAVRCDGTDHPMTPVVGGWWEETVPDVGAGTSYAFGAMTACCITRRTRLTARLMI